MIRTHYGQHGPTCFGCKLHSVQFGSVEPSPQTLMERRWERDRPAYKRMRAQGLQPRQIEGCAELEAKAHDQMEIDLHKLIEPSLLRRFKPEIDEGMAMARESDWNPVETHGHATKGA